MEIREATDAELEAIIQIEKTCFPPAEAAKEEDIRKRFETFKENFIVAIQEERVIGFING